MLFFELGREPVNVIVNIVYKIIEFPGLEKVKK